MTYSSKKYVWGAKVQVLANLHVSPNYLPHPPQPPPLSSLQMQQRFHFPLFCVTMNTVETGPQHYAESRTELLTLNDNTV